MKLSYNDPRYTFIKSATQEFVRHEFEMIPTVLFTELASHRGDQEDVLQLVGSRYRECPACGEEADQGKPSAVDPDDFEWSCTSCDATHETQDSLWSELPLRGPTYAWPGAHGFCFWTTFSVAANLAPTCGFLVYEPRDFDGYILAIDGGGYDFYHEHWIPLYLALQLEWHTREKGWRKANAAGKRLEKEARRKAREEKKTS